VISTSSYASQEIISNLSSRILTILQASKNSTTGDSQGTIHHDEDPAYTKPVNASPEMHSTDKEEAGDSRKSGKKLARMLAECEISNTPDLKRPEDYNFGSVSNNIVYVPYELVHGTDETRYHSICKKSSGLGIVQEQTEHDSEESETGPLAESAKEPPSGMEVYDQQPSDEELLDNVCVIDEILKVKMVDGRTLHWCVSLQNSTMPSQVLLDRVGGRPLASCVKYNMKLTMGKIFVVWYPQWVTTNRVPIDLMERYLDELQERELRGKCSPT